MDGAADAAPPHHYEKCNTPQSLIACSGWRCQPSVPELHYDTCHRWQSEKGGRSETDDERLRHDVLKTSLHFCSAWHQGIVHFIMVCNKNPQQWLIAYKNWGIPSKKHHQHQYRIHNKHVQPHIVQQLSSSLIHFPFFLNARQSVHCYCLTLPLASGYSNFLMLRFHISVNNPTHSSKTDYLHHGCTQNERKWK